MAPPYRCVHPAPDTAAPRIASPRSRCSVHWHASLILVEAPSIEHGRELLRTSNSSLLKPRTSHPNNGTGLKRGPHSGFVMFRLSNLKHPLSPRTRPQTYTHTRAREQYPPSGNREQYPPKLKLGLQMRAEDAARPPLENLSFRRRSVVEVPPEVRFGPQVFCRPFWKSSFRNDTSSLEIHCAKPPLPGRPSS